MTILRSVSAFKNGAFSAKQASQTRARYSDP